MDIFAIVPDISMAYIVNGKLKTPSLNENDTKIVELIKPFESHPWGEKNICLIQNGENDQKYKDICYGLNIKCISIKEKQWVEYHGLNLAVKQEKGMDYSILSELEKDLRHLSTHLKIENNVKNDEVYAGDVKHILNTSGKHEARKMLCDDYLYFTKQQLKESIEQTEKEISKFKSQEKTIRKNRYKDYANKVYIKSLIGDNVERIKSLGNNLSIDLFGFFYANKAITPAELRKLFKSYNLKPLTLAECDAVLILLYQLNK